jgi:hypothetical protein
MSNNVVSNCFVANNLAYVQTLNVSNSILEGPSPHYLPTIVVVRCCIFWGSRGVCIFCKMGFAMMDLAKNKILHVGGVYVFNHMGSSSPMVGGMASYGKAFSTSLLHQKFMTLIMMANNNVGNVLEFTIPITHS